MTELNLLSIRELRELLPSSNDQNVQEQPALETSELPSGEPVVNKLMVVTDVCGATVDEKESKAANASTSVENDCNLLNSAKPKGKRRRRKSNRSKQKSNNKPYKKSNWKFQRRSRMFCVDDAGIVPYNTNKFLMEEHMPEAILGRVSPSGRTRNSSFSVDSEDYYNALPEDEEAFLTKEFSSVYEIARSERLDGMSRIELMKEYIHLEANYDKLSKTLGARVSFDVDAKAKDFESKIVISRLEERVKQLTDENLELRRLMADIRNRGKRSLSHGSHYTISSTSSEDSESDSDSTTSSSNTSRSRTKSNSSSDVEVVDTLNCNSNHIQNSLE